MSPPCNKPIPMLDLSPQIDMLWGELNEAIQRVLRSGQFILGPEVAAFEKEAAAYLGVKHAIGVNSGTDALIIGLRALGIGPGDEVITTPFSFFATAESICNVGATPVFVDVEEESMNINPELIENAITEKTRAIMPVHLFGRPASMGRIMEIAKQYDLKVIEDCAQSFGARYFVDSDHCPCRDPNMQQNLDNKQTGSIGNIGAFSFYPTKSLGAFGDGGMITTNNDKVAALARMLQDHGSAQKYKHDILGYNSRLDALQASLLRIKLPYVDIWNEQRHKTARVYHDNLKHMEAIIVPKITKGHIFHQYTLHLKTKKRCDIQRALTKQQIATTVYYPITQDKLYAHMQKRVDISINPIAESLSNKVLSIPIWPGISLEKQQTLMHSLQRCLNHNI